MLTTLIVNYNSSKFIELSSYAINSLTKSRNKILVCDNGSTFLEKQYLKKISEQYRNIELFFRKQSEKGSIGHAEALDFLMQKVNTPYTVILDADATFLYPGWDELLINKIDRDVKIIGSPVVKNPIKPDDFPYVFATLFETETFKKLGISFMPKDHQKGLDTGFEMREKYLANGYKGICFEARNTRYYKEGPFKDMLCSEYYYENKLIATHFGRGSTSGKNKYIRGTKIIHNLPLIRNVYTISMGMKEKQIWLKRCKEIISNHCKETMK